VNIDTIMRVIRASNLFAFCRWLAYEYFTFEASHPYSAIKRQTWKDENTSKSRNNE